MSQKFVTEVEKTVPPRVRLASTRGTQSEGLSKYRLCILNTYSGRNKGDLGSWSQTPDDISSGDGTTLPVHFYCVSKEWS